MTSPCSPSLRVRDKTPHYACSPHLCRPFCFSACSRFHIQLLALDFSAGPVCILSALPSVCWHPTRPLVSSANEDDGVFWGEENGLWLPKENGLVWMDGADRACMDRVWQEPRARGSPWWHLMGCNGRLNGKLDDHVFADSLLNSANHRPLSCH